MKYQVTVNGRSHEVTLVARTQGSVLFEAGGKVYDVEIQPCIELSANAPTPPHRAPQTTSSAPPARRSAAPGEILAPMPGIIVALPLCEGSDVRAGETICVIEAMKMENNIPSPVTGKIARIHVKPGQEVSGAQLLLTLQA